MYLWPIKKNLENFLEEANSKTNLKELIDQWFSLESRTDKNAFFPLSFNDHFVYFLTRISNDDRHDFLLNQAIKYYLEEIDKGETYFEEHLDQIRKLKSTFNHFTDDELKEISTTLIPESLQQIKHSKPESKIFFTNYYTTDSFIVTDQIGSTKIEFTKFALIALTNNKFAFYDIGDHPDDIRKKANSQIIAFQQNNFDPSKGHCLGEFEEKEDRIIFKQYMFNMHPRIFNILPNGDLINDNRIFKKTSFT